MTRKLFKTLSLLESARAGITVPPTTLFLHRNSKALRKFIRLWQLPLMVRVDYERLPIIKPLGGIPVCSEEAIGGVLDYLLLHDCFPVVHPNIDRFEDQFSVGVLFNKLRESVHIEVVGSGFDASDLRLGEFVPHERMEMRLSDGGIESHFQIAKEAYVLEILRRKNKIWKLRQYTEYVARNKRMLGSLDFLPGGIPKESAPAHWPESYSPLPARQTRELWLITKILEGVIRKKLPPSPTYVASLSLVKGNWLLWDIYGSWYGRR